ncbi:MAG TPA: glycosyltransferase [Prolixibacteraceae bacterium]|nr:glycosyltransferase [Prolixibacteraceae bacterium]HPS13803.1 glycosyltransferase [Prolixibacteraceae bacterium]
MIAALIIFWLCVVAMAHSYLFYPVVLWMKIKWKGRRTYASFVATDHLPTLSILMAAFNEELVIERKIRSIYETTYPLEKVEIWVGSDHSTDGTNEIVERLAGEFPSLHFIRFESRQGKINIINQLFDQASGEILIITDANVLFGKEMLFEVVRYFRDERVGLVDTHMKNYGLKKDGISIQEKSYISREVYVKHLESEAHGAMIGPFGGCYAVRKNLYMKVPSNYLVDDFFVCLGVLATGKSAINNLDAEVFEDVSNNLAIEFKRKIRIATGDFQNLKFFRRLLWPPYRPVAFCFLSHKVLRWFGPFFLIGAFLSNFVLFQFSDFYKLLFFLQVMVMILPFVDFILKKFHLHVVLLRFITHFYSMNLSLLIGFIKSIRGVETNVWKPTKRLQE